MSAVFFATTKKIVRIFLLPTATITRAPLDTNQRERGIGKETHTRQIMINTDVCTIHMFALCEINCDMSSKRNHIGQLKIFVGLVRKTHTHTDTASIARLLAAWLLTFFLRLKQYIYFVVVYV